MKESNEIKKLKETIKDMSREKVYLVKENELIIKEKEAEHKVTFAERETSIQREKTQLAENIASARAENVQLKEQIKNSPYNKLNDILKALVVKLPTLDVKSINVTAKSK